MKKIKVDFFICAKGDLRTTSKNDADAHIKQNLKIINGKPNIDGHIIENLKGKEF